MPYRQLSFRRPWHALKSFARLENESPRRSSEPTDEAKTSASAADTIPYTPRLPVGSHEIDPEQLPLQQAQALETNETMEPLKSHKEPSSHFLAKNQTQTASKLPSPSKLIPQSPVAYNKSSSASTNASPSHDTSKPSSPAGKASPTHDTLKPSSPVGKAFPNHDTSKPSSPAGKISPSQDTTNPSSRAAATLRSQIGSEPPSPSKTCIKNHLQPKPTSQSRPKADSQPSSPSQSAFPPQASSIPWSPSHENAQQPSKKTSRVQSPSHLSSKPTAQPTSQQHIEPPAIGDQTTNTIASHPASQSPQAIPKSREIPLQIKPNQSPKPDSKPVETRASKDQPETKEELTSKNTSYPNSNQDSYEIPIEIDETITNSREPSLQSQAKSKENEEIESNKENPAMTTNAFQTSASKSKLITSAEIPTPFEPQKKDSQQEGTMENSSKAFHKLNIKYPAEVNPESFTTLTAEENTESSIHIHRQYKSDTNKSPKTSAGIEENFNHKTHKDYSRTEEDPAVELYTNTNVQGIKNSIMSNSSFSENNPGINLKYVREPAKSEDKSQTRKAKYEAKSCRENYLLMESGDSQKLRRHGCR